MYEPVFTDAWRWHTPYHLDRYRWLGQELAVAVIRGIALILATWYVASMAIRSRRVERRRLLAAVLPVLTIADLLAAHWSDSPTVPPSYWTYPPESVRVLKSDPGLIRLFGEMARSAAEPGYASQPVDFFPARDTLAYNLAPAWGLSSSGVLTPIIPRRSDRYDAAAMRAGVRFEVEGVTHLLSGSPGDAGSPGAFGPPVHAGTASIFRNKSALPRARLMGRPVYADDEDGAVAALVRLGRAARDRPVIEDPTRPLSPDAAASGTATIAIDLPEHIEIDTNSAGPSYLILADTFDPGWSATIDGLPATIRPAYIAFRAVFVPAGHHRVVFRYSPPGFVAGMVLSIFGTLAAIGFVAWPRRVFDATTGHGDAGWPRRWPMAMAGMIAILILFSTIANRSRRLDRHPVPVGAELPPLHLGVGPGGLSPSARRAERTGRPPVRRLARVGSSPSAPSPGAGRRLPRLCVRPLASPGGGLVSRAQDGPSRLAISGRRPPLSPLARLPPRRELLRPDLFRPGRLDRSHGPCESQRPRFDRPVRHPRVRADDLGGRSGSTCRAVMAGPSAQWRASSASARPPCSDSAG